MLRSFAKGTRRRGRRGREGKGREGRGGKGETRSKTARRREKKIDREKERRMERRKMLGVGKTGERTEDIELKWPLGTHSSIPLSLP